MNKLTGIRAFEARWQSIKSTCRTSATDNKILMQAMGRLVDNYATHEEIISELPAKLQDVFDRLVDAYLNGYWLDEESGNVSSTQMRTHEAAAISPAMLAARQLRQRRQQQPTESSEAATYIIHDPVEHRHNAFGSAFA